MNKENKKQLTIAAIKRDAGLTMDTLRIWERRYGFPAPARDENGDRVYSNADLFKIRLVKRLINHGFRPGKIMHLDVATLQTMLPEEQSDTIDSGTEIIKLLKAHDIQNLRKYLRDLLSSQGLERFVVEHVASMNHQVGDAWMYGLIAIFEEHIYAEQIQTLLHTSISQLSTSPSSPKILLTTLPGEQHTLGIMMVETLLSIYGATCLDLGAETPVSEIQLAVNAHQIDILCLSFSTVFPKTKCLNSLAELRERLPESVAIWVGGEGVPHSKLAAGVTHFPSLVELESAVTDWRKSH
ncbi:MAG: MerR family transcriptional regulator [Sulfuriferula sp.]